MIRALIINDVTPPKMLLTKSKFYRVLSCTKYSKQDVWTKRLTDDTKRLFIFELNNDSGTKIELAFDIDDPTILFLTDNEIEELTK